VGAVSGPDCDSDNDVTESLRKKGTYPAGAGGGGQTRRGETKTCGRKAQVLKMR